MACAASGPFNTKRSRTHGGSGVDGRHVSFTKSPRMDACGSTLMTNVFSTFRREAAGSVSELRISMGDLARLPVWQNTMWISKHAASISTYRLRGRRRRDQRRRRKALRANRLATTHTRNQRDHPPRCYRRTCRHPSTRPSAPMSEFAQVKHGGTHSLTLKLRRALPRASTHTITLVEGSVNWDQRRARTTHLGSD